MDDATRLYWEKVADQCFDRAYETALNAVTYAANHHKEKKHLNPSGKSTGQN